MDNEDALDDALALADESRVAMLGTNGDDGYPNIKAMLKMENEGLTTIWFSTNSSSKRVAQLAKDSSACVYFVDDKGMKGLMLLGQAEVLQDAASRERLWREGFERYYPLGMCDPDYSVIRFTAQRGNYYHAQRNVNFEVGR